MSVTYLSRTPLRDVSRAAHDLDVSMFPFWGRPGAQTSARFPFAIGDDCELSGEALSRRMGGVIAALSHRRWTRVSIDVSADADGVAAVLACLVAGITFTTKHTLTTEHASARGCEMLPVDAHPSTCASVLRVSELADRSLTDALASLDLRQADSSLTRVHEMISLLDLDETSAVLTWLSPNTTAGWSVIAATCLVGGTVTVIDGMRFCAMTEPWLEYAQRLAANRVAIPVPRATTIDCGASVREQRFANERLRVIACGSIPVMLLDVP